MNSHINVFVLGGTGTSYIAKGKKEDILLSRLIDICIDSIEREKIGVSVFGCTGMSYIAEVLRANLRQKSTRLLLLSH